MQAMLLFATILAPIVLAFVELVKRTEVAPKRVLPIVAVFIGLVVAYSAFPFSDLDLPSRLWAGALAGLSATGLFELAIKTKQEVK